MTLDAYNKLSAHIMRLLKVNEVTFPIGRTSKGNLEIKFNINNNDFDLVLDSVPLSTKNMLEDDKNIELKGLVGKYFFSKETVSRYEETVELHESMKKVIEPKPETVPKKKLGRPKKVT